MLCTSAGPNSSEAGRAGRLQLGSRTMTDGNLEWVIFAVACAIGLYLLIAPGRVTARAKERTKDAQARFGHRPKMLRPQRANEHPSTLKTRLTGLGFLLIGGVALWQRLK